ncbi:uncharacterized protein METZ01_LOCUS336841, partial [marine metagenome]
VIKPNIFLIDGNTDYRPVNQCLGIPITLLAQPIQEISNGGDFWWRLELLPTNTNL